MNFLPGRTACELGVSHHLTVGVQGPVHLSQAPGKAGPLYPLSCWMRALVCPPWTGAQTPWCMSVLTGKTLVKPGGSQGAGSLCPGHLDSSGLTLRSGHCAAHPTLAACLLLPAKVHVPPPWAPSHRLQQAWPWRHVKSSGSLTLYFEHYFTSVWHECNYAVVWAFFGIAFLWDWNENWPFPVLWPLLSFPNLLAYGVQHFHSIIFQDLKYFNWNSITSTSFVRSDAFFFFFWG